MRTQNTHITLNVLPRTGLHPADLFQWGFFLIMLIMFSLQPLTYIRPNQGSHSS